MQGLPSNVHLRHSRRRGCCKTLRSADKCSSHQCRDGRAVGLGDSGSIYFGVNIEFPGVPLNQSVRLRRFPCSLLDMRLTLHWWAGAEQMAWKRVPAVESSQTAPEASC